MKILKTFEAYINKDGKLEDLSQDNINEILRGYLEAAIWTEEENLQEDINSRYDDESDVKEIVKVDSFTIDDIDIDSKIDSYEDIKKFIKLAGDVAVKEAIDENGYFRLGMDIWLSRNGHGSGFFDWSYENEKALTKAADDLKSKELYIGDDFKLYFQ